MITFAMRKRQKIIPWKSLKQDFLGMISLRYACAHSRNVATANLAKRIGIKKSKDFPWRFYIKDNPHVSKK